MIDVQLILTVAPLFDFNLTMPPTEYLFNDAIDNFALLAVVMSRLFKNLAISSNCGNASRQSEATADGFLKR